MKLFNNKNKLSLHVKKLFIGTLIAFAFLVIYSNFSKVNNDDFLTLAELEKEFSSVLENDTMIICKESTQDDRMFTSTTIFKNKLKSSQSDSTSLPIIYFVTPTYPRREQIAELTRLGQTLMHVKNLHWILADDTEHCNKHLDSLLDRFGIPYTHIASPMPKNYRNTKKSIPRGVSNRRASLTWIKNNNKKDGVLYFGDDDNTFDLRLFSEIRDTKIVSMFPVGLIGEYSVSSPVVKDGKVIGFFDSWPAKRLWPVDMAGFAVNLSYMAKFPNATMPYKAGYEEDEFLKSIGLKIDDIEPKANNCTEILVWHTQTSKTKAPLIRVPESVDVNKTSLRLLLKNSENLNVNHASSSGGVKATITKDGIAITLKTLYGQAIRGNAENNLQVTDSNVDVAPRSYQRIRKLILVDQMANELYKIYMRIFMNGDQTIQY